MRRDGGWPFKRNEVLWIYPHLKGSVLWRRGKVVQSFIVGFECKPASCHLSAASRVAWPSLGSLQRDCQRLVWRVACARQVGVSHVLDKFCDRGILESLAAASSVFKREWHDEVWQLAFPKTEFMHSHPHLKGSALRRRGKVVQSCSVSFAALSPGFQASSQKVSAIFSASFPCQHLDNPLVCPGQVSCFGAAFALQASLTPGPAPSALLGWQP